MNKIKFTVIIPIYNRESFLEETIESVIQQDYGFENVELILIDDGSTDESGRICDDYAAKYPKQIKVIHQENNGVSSARNRGVQMATGDYLNFLDSDDQLAANAMEEVAEFIHQYGQETDVIALPIYFFDGQKGGHALNSKFNKGTRVIDLCEEWNKPQMSLNSTFIRAEIAKKYAFDEDVHIAVGEDAREVLKCMYEKETLGVVTGTKYWYRKHAQYSLLGDAIGKRERYTDNVKFFHEAVFNWYKERKGYVPKFVQNSLFYDIQWRLRQEKLPVDILEPEEMEEYKDRLKNVICQMDDEVIIKQSKLYKEHYSYAFYLKYNSLPDIVEEESGKAFFHYEGSNIEGIPVDSMPIRLEMFSARDNIVKLEGFVFHYTFLSEEVGRYSVKIDDELYDLVIQKDSRIKRSMDQIVYERYRFTVEVPVKSRKTKMTFVFHCGNKDYELRHYLYGKFFPMDPNTSKSYFHKNGILFYVKDGAFIIKTQKMPSPLMEARYITDLLKKKRRGVKKAVFVRFAYHLMKCFFRRPIWIIMDRLDKADDNGEIFFTYLQNLEKPSAKIYYAIKKDSPDYERMKKIGPVIDPTSIQYKFLFLFAEYFLSSQADEMILNCFKGYRYGYKNLNMPKFIFLQHGIIMNDLSDWLNRYNKNIYGFITTTEKERDFIIDLFGYSPENVWLTGMPRFDRLIDEKEKIITILPTWRKELRPKKNLTDDTEKFKESEYYQFYHSLLTDKRLLDAGSKYGYGIQFKLHPALMDYRDTFDNTSGVKIIDRDIPYREIYSKSALIVTDYSSAVFDFAYLNKPVIYAQFDEDTFFAGAHILKRGYFDYRRDGVGEVETSLDDVVNRIIEYMENDCKMKDLYQKRIETFFAFRDRKNCERIYEKLLQKEIK